MPWYERSTGLKAGDTGHDGVVASASEGAEQPLGNARRRPRISCSNQPVSKSLD